jgi:4-amino-4-deoxy-L-arabinose transferase-like glycosyltransferase
LTIAILAFFLILTRVWEHIGLAALSAFVLLLLVLYPGIFQGGNFTETYAILPIVLSLGAFWAYLRSGHKRWLIALGVLTAAGFLLKPTYISIGVVAGFTIAYLELRRRSIKNLVVNLLILGVSVLLPTSIHRPVLGGKAGFL